MDAAISRLTLPEASGGNGTLSYSLAPTVPGLTFATATRTLSGTPTSAGTYDKTYQAVDGDANTAAGDAATLTFTITVQPATTPVGCSANADTWRGLRVCSERPRAGYLRDDFGTGHSRLEDDIIAALPSTLIIAEELVGVTQGSVEHMAMGTDHPETKRMLALRAATARCSGWTRSGPCARYDTATRTDTACSIRADST